MLTSRIRCFVFALAGLALFGCASRPAAVVATTAPVADASDVQCHYESVTGSMFKRRVCLTKAERDARDGFIDDMKAGLDRQRSIACPGGGAPPCKPF